MAREYTIENFTTGLVNEIEDKSIPADAASNSLNWLTLGDRIELTGGYNIVGTEASGSGKITGLSVGEDVQGNPVAYRTRGQKLETYNTSTTAWDENGSNLLGSEANNEDIAIQHYTSIAGYFTYVSSPNSGLFKIHNSFPTGNKSLYVSGTNFKGYIRVVENRMFAWNTSENFQNILNVSHRDTQDEYTSTTGEVLDTGDGLTAFFSGTLANITATRTVHAVVVTDGTETFNDNRDGTLTGDAGGTGTINYTTGAIAVTFNTNVTNLQDITVDYDYEDSNVTGITNFNFTIPVRLVNESYFLPQSTGGDILNILPYNQEFYCIHEKNAWLHTMPADDLNPTNKVYREKVGMKNWRAAVATGDGIYYIDSSDPNTPRFKKLRINIQNNLIEPEVISFNVDLTGYNFDQGVAFEFDDYILFSGRTTDSTKNNRLFGYHKIYKSFDQLGYYVNNMANYNGELWAGDSATDNVQRLFTNFSANGSVINNYWEGNLSKLQVDELKKFKRLTIQGNIQKSQVVKVYLSYDRGTFQEIGEIGGDQSYVDVGSSVTIGSQQLGSSVVGGGSSSSVQANNYIREFRVRSPKFDRAKIRLVAQNAGYVSVSMINYFDIKRYGQKNVKRYRQTL